MPRGGELPEKCIQEFTNISAVRMFVVYIVVHYFWSGS